MTSPTSLIGLTNPNHNPRSERAIDRVLADFSTSYWLKEAIKALMERDPLDAARDAQILADLMAARQHALRMS